MEIHSASPTYPAISASSNSVNSSGEVVRTLVSNGSNNRLKLQHQQQDGAFSSSKGDSKVLEWSSFPPEVIRDYYLSRRSN